MNSVELGIVILLLLPQALEKGKSQLRLVRNWLERRQIHKGTV